MKKIKVEIKEKDKGSKTLSLLNLRDEVVNFLYKDTIANSTKADLQFFVLLFFISIQVKGRTLLESIFDESIPKFKKLNLSFSGKKGRLHSGEYEKLVKENELSEIFKYDIFFILIEAILNIEEIEKKFATFTKAHPEIGKTLKAVKYKYFQKLNAGLKTFQSSKIEDDRYDDRGNYHDLSKSVYRTVRMRNSRNLDLNLQKYTSIEEITSKSPIDLTFFQHIDPQIIFDLWDKYHLAEYVQEVATEAVTTIRNHFDFNINLGDLVNAWLIYKWTHPNERKEKAKAKQALENTKAKPKSGKALEELTSTLIRSVLNANERLKKEIEEGKKQIRELTKKEIVVQDKEAIKKLEDRIAQLENLSVKAEVIEEGK